MGLAAQVHAEFCCLGGGSEEAAQVSLKETRKGDLRHKGSAQKIMHRSAATSEFQRN